MNSTIDDVIFKDNLKKVPVKSGETMQDPYHPDKPFLSKQLVYIEDQNHSTDYGSNQIKFSTKNQGGMCDIQNAVFTLPKVAVLYRQKTNGAASPCDIPPEDVHNQLMFKSGHINDIDSAKIDCNSTSVIQQRQNFGAYVNYRHNSEMSIADLLLNGSMTGDYKNSNNYDYNNETGFTTDAFGDFFPNKFVAFDAASGKSQIMNEDNIKTDGLNYHETHFKTTAAVAGTGDVANPQFPAYTEYEHVYYYTSYIRARDIPFLQDLCMIQGSDIEITFTLNQSETIVTVVPTGGAAGLKSDKTSIVNNLRGSTNPLLRSNEIEHTNAMGSYKEHVSWKVVSHKSYLDSTKVYTHNMKYCRMYIPTYILEPSAREHYLSFGTKKIVYDDYIIKEVPNINGNFSETLIQSVANVKKLVIVPVFRHANGKTLNGVQNDNAQRCMYSASPALPCPVVIQDFNVKIAGLPVYTDLRTYGWENFLKEMDGSEGLYGNTKMGLVSGLIGKEEYQNNYKYYVVDLSRRAKVDYDKGFQVHIQGNMKSPATVDLLCYLVVKREAIVNLNTGEISNVR